MNSIGKPVEELVEDYNFPFVNTKMREIVSYLLYVFIEENLSIYIHTVKLDPFIWHIIVPSIEIPIYKKVVQRNIIHMVPYYEFVS